MCLVPTGCVCVFPPTCNGNIINSEGHAKSTERSLQKANVNAKHTAASRSKRINCGDAKVATANRVAKVSSLLPYRDSQATSSLSPPRQQTADGGCPRSWHRIARSMSASAASPSPLSPGIDRGQRSNQQIQCQHSCPFSCCLHAWLL